MFWICIHCAREGRGSPTLWSTYYEIKAVLEAPVIEKRKVQTIYDDSRRIVDMTEIKPNLYIGDELITLKTLRALAARGLWVSLNNITY